MSQDIKPMHTKAQAISEFMKCFSSPHRLLILCQLVQGEQNVTQLIEATGIAQTSMSQHLAKLKSEQIVDFRREHRTLYYRISDPNAFKIMSTLFDMYCKE